MMAGSLFAYEPKEELLNKIRTFVEEVKAENN